MARQPARTVRSAIVTGAAGAFGSATATALRRRGVAVIGLDRSPGADIVACDVTRPAAVTSAVDEALARLGGRLDLLVHFAGVGPAVDAGRPPGDEVGEALSVNLLGAWRVTGAALPALIAGPERGRVVPVASLLAGVTVPFASAYSVSKRALTGYADALRVEYGDRLAVTTVLPGYVDTPIHERSRAAGVALDGLVPAESVGDVVATVLRVAGRRRPPREVATTRTGTAVRLAVRHAPGVVEAVVGARMRRLLADGAFAGAPLAEAMRSRLGAGAPELERSGS